MAKNMLTFEEIVLPKARSPVQTTRRMAPIARVAMVKRVMMDTVKKFHQLDGNCESEEIAQNWKKNLQDGADSGKDGLRMKRAKCVDDNCGNDGHGFLC